MKLQTSFCNQAIIKNDLKRFGFIGIIYGLLTLVINNIGVIPNLLDDYEIQRLEGQGTQLITGIFPNAWDVMAIFGVGFILALVLFRYLQEEKALTAMHAFPVSRRSLFGSHIVAFWLILYVPMLANSLISVLIMAVLDVPLKTVFLSWLVYLMKMILAGNMVFFFTVLVGMLVGSSVLQGILSLSLMGMPFALVELFKVLLRWIVIGYPYAMNDQAWHYSLTPYYSIIMLVMEDEWSILLRPLVAVVLILVLSLIGSYFFYLKRALEKHHDFVAFKSAKAILVAIFTAFTTLGLASLIGSMMGNTPTGAYIGLVAGSAIGFGVTQMVAQKTLQVYRYYKMWIGVVAGCLLLFILIDLDVTGYEDRIPDLDQIERVYLSDDSNNFLRRFNNTLVVQTLPETIRGGYSLYLEDQASIDLVRSLQGALVAKAKAYNNKQQYHEVEMAYILKSGQVIHRSYSRYDEESFTKKLYESQGIKDRIMASYEYYLFESRDPNVTLNGLNFQVQAEGVIEPERYRSFFQAYKMDLQDMTYYESISNEEVLNLEIDYIYASSDNGYNGYENRRYLSMPVFPTFKHTLAWLEEEGYDLLIFHPELATGARIFKEYEEDSYSVSEEVQVVVEKTWPGDPNQDGLLIEEAQVIEALMVLEPSYDKPLEALYQIEIYFDNYQTYRFSLSNLPKELEEYVGNRDYY